MNTIPQKKKVYTKSNKGFDFNNKPLNQNTYTDAFYGWWSDRVFMIGEKHKDSCSLYTEKDGKPVFAFEVKYKNLSLVKVDVK